MTEIDLFNVIYNMDALELARRLPANSVDCVITSPPYPLQRVYGDVPGQWGIEDTLDEYLDRMVALFAEIKRVLKPTGTIWINIGDKYVTNPGNGRGGGHPGWGGTPHRSGSDATRGFVALQRKSLIFIPARLAIRLMDEVGLILRNDNIWWKPNAQPESVRDRASRDHEYVFQFTKSEKYFADFESVRQPVKPSTIQRMKRGVGSNHKYTDGAPGQARQTMAKPRLHDKTRKARDDRNLRTVWGIATRKSCDEHFATFPIELPMLCITAGCPVGGLVFDPFMGSGTTAEAARRLNRNYIGAEINPEYVEIARRRLSEPVQIELFGGVDDANG
ncbi:MAG: site-specific DNA-methyltransferase [Chloroflexi bacterium]|nr:MAG: site-specific DNA-methyltransferase [Chloroflexota bacterium]